MSSETDHQRDRDKPRPVASAPGFSQPSTLSAYNSSPTKSRTDTHRARTSSNIINADLVTLACRAADVGTDANSSSPHALPRVRLPSATHPASIVPGTFHRERKDTTPSSQSNTLPRRRPQVEAVASLGSVLTTADARNRKASAANVRPLVQPASVPAPSLKKAKSTVLLSPHKEKASSIRPPLRTSGNSYEHVMTRDRKTSAIQAAHPERKSLKTAKSAVQLPRIVPTTRLQDYRPPTPIARPQPYTFVTAPPSTSTARRALVPAPAPSHPITTTAQPSALVSTHSAETAPFSTEIPARTMTTKDVQMSYEDNTVTLKTVETSIISIDVGEDLGSRLMRQFRDAAQDVASNESRSIAPDSKLIDSVSTISGGQEHPTRIESTRGRDHTASAASRPAFSRRSRSRGPAAALPSTVVDEEVPPLPAKDFLVNPKNLMPAKRLPHGNRGTSPSPSPSKSSRARAVTDSSSSSVASNNRDTMVTCVTSLAGDLDTYMDLFPVPPSSILLNTQEEKAPLRSHRSRVPQPLAVCNDVFDSSDLPTPRPTKVNRERSGSSSDSTHSDVPSQYSFQGHTPGSSLSSLPSVEGTKTSSKTATVLTEAAAADASLTTPVAPAAQPKNACAKVSWPHQRAEIQSMVHSTWNDAGRLVSGTTFEVLVYLMQVPFRKPPAHFPQPATDEDDTPNESYLRAAFWAIFRHHVSAAELLAYVRTLYAGRRALRDVVPKDFLVEEIAGNWFDRNWLAETDEPILEDVRKWIEKDVRPSNVVHADYLTFALGARTLRYTVRPTICDILSSDSGARILPTKFELPPDALLNGYLKMFMTGDGLEEFVRQLTKLFNGAYIALPPPMMLVLDWYLGGEDRRALAPERELLDMYNNLQKWVIRVVTDANDEESALEGAEFWMNVGEKCFERRNLSAAAAIFDGLSQTVCRRKWEKNEGRLVSYKNKMLRLGAKVKSGYVSFKAQAEVWTPGSPPENYHGLMVANGANDEHPFVPHLARHRAPATRHKGGGRTALGWTEDGQLVLNVAALRELSQMCTTLEWGYRQYEYTCHYQTRQYIQAKLADMQNYVPPSIMDYPGKARVRRDTAVDVKLSPTLPHLLLQAHLPKATQIVKTPASSATPPAPTSSPTKPTPLPRRPDYVPKASFKGVAPPF